MGKMMESGPVLIITFQTQQIMVVRDSKGNIVEGDPV
jgi:import inner membrane translocase subunit TIM44